MEKSTVFTQQRNDAKEISKLDNLTKRKIKKDIETKLLKDPVGSSTKLRDFKVQGVRRFRAGNYRVIFVKILEIIIYGRWKGVVLFETNY